MSTIKLGSFDETVFIFKFFLWIFGVLPEFFVREQMLLKCFDPLIFIDSSMFHIDTIFKNSTSLDEIYKIFGINVRFYILLTKRRELTELWNCFDANTQLLMMNFERKIRILFWMIFASISICINLLNSFNVIHVSYLSKENLNVTKILPFRWYEIEDIELSWRGCSITFTLKFWIACNSTLISATVDATLLLLMTICCDYFRVLREKFKNVNCESYGDQVIDDYDLLYSVVYKVVQRTNSKIVILTAQHPLNIVILSLQNFFKMFNRALSFFMAMRNFIH